MGAAPGADGDPDAQVTYPGERLPIGGGDAAFPVNQGAVNIDYQKFIGVIRQNIILYLKNYSGYLVS